MAGPNDPTTGPDDLYLTQFEDPSLREKEPTVPLPTRGRVRLEIPELGFTGENLYEFDGVSVGPDGKPTIEGLGQVKAFRDGILKSTEDYKVRRDNDMRAERIRDVAELVGGVAGAFAGSRVNAPNIGGSLGTAVARLGADATMGALNRVGAFPMNDEEGADIFAAGASGGVDLMFGAAFDRVAPGAKRLFLYGGKKSQEAAKSALKGARQLGGKLGIQDVSDRWYIAGFKNIVGQFPGVSKPFIEARGIREASARDVSDNLVTSVAPIAGLMNRGFNIAKAVQRTTTGMRRALNQRYEVVLDTAEKHHVFTPTDKTRKAVFDGIEEELEASPRLDVRSGVTLPNQPSLPSGLPNPYNVHVFNVLSEKFLDKKLTKQLASLAEGVPLAPREFQKLKKRLDRELGRLAPQPGQAIPPEWHFLNKVRTALVEEDLPHSYGPNPTATKTFLDDYRAANADFANMMHLLTTPTAAAVRRFDPAAFKRGVLRATGGQTAEAQLISHIRQDLAKGSRQELEDIYRLLGPEQFRVAAADYLDDVIGQSFKASENGELFFDTNHFRKTFGLEGSALTGVQLAERRNFLNALNSKVGNAFDPKKLEQFGNFMQAALREGSPDPNQFLERSIVFGTGAGRQQMTMPQLVVRAMFGGLPGGIKGLAQLRLFGRYISNPERADSLLRALEPGAPEKLRQNEVARITRFMLATSAEVGKAFLAEMDQTETGLGFGDREAIAKRIKEAERLALALDKDPQVREEMMRQTQQQGPARRMPTPGAGLR